MKRIFHGVIKQGLLFNDILVVRTSQVLLFFPIAPPSSNCSGPDQRGTRPAWPAVPDAYNRILP